MNTWSSVQSIHAQAGVVGECPLSRLCRNGKCFDSGVGAERAAGFLNLQSIGLGFHRERKFTQKPFELPHLARVAAGNHQCLVGHAQALSAKLRAQASTAATRSLSGASQYNRSKGSVPEKRNINQ
ncbi:MAG: Uncharacterised protein [Cyanobium sp. ARS6]|nr:MAG: Uncharacterised protein [Cyanobium sp. ARS6]